MSPAPPPQTFDFKFLQSFVLRLCLFVLLFPSFVLNPFPNYWTFKVGGLGTCSWLIANNWRWKKFRLCDCTPYSLPPQMAPLRALGLPYYRGPKIFVAPLTAQGSKHSFDRLKIPLIDVRFTDVSLHIVTQVMVHTSYQFPDAGDGICLRSERGRRLNIMISPVITVTSHRVKDLSVSTRGCVFPDERELYIYHVYTQSSCLIQCRMEYIANTCGCHMYFFTAPSKWTRFPFRRIISIF
jgi:hypothetical protein